MSATESQLRLRSYLEERRNSYCRQLKRPSPLYYRGMEDFVLREGRFFEARPLTSGTEYMEVHHCIKNAFWTALLQGFLYVEGYAVPSGCENPTLHAWNLDRDGFVVDVSWNPHWQAYLGIIFPLSAIRRKRSTQYSIIDDWEDGYPILRTAWDKEAAHKQAFEELKIEERQNPISTGSPNDDW